MQWQTSNVRSSHDSQNHEVFSSVRLLARGRSITIWAKGACCRSPEDSPTHHEVSRHSQFFHFGHCVSFLRKCCQKAYLGTPMWALYLQWYTARRSARTLHQFVLCHTLQEENNHSHVSSSMPPLLVPTSRFLTSPRTCQQPTDVFLGVPHKRRLLAPTPISPMGVLVTVAMQVIHLVHISH